MIVVERCGVCDGDRWVDRIGRDGEREKDLCWSCNGKPYKYNGEKHETLPTEEEYIIKD